MSFAQKHYRLTCLAAVVLLALWVISSRNYLLFHTAAELFSIVVACCIFVVAWNSRHVAENGYLLFLGIAYLFVAALDVLHTLAFQGMGVFQGGGTNLAAQLWISARYVESSSLLITPLLVERKLREKLVFVSYGAITALLLAAVFRWAVFPACFVEGAGLTLFKKVSEYVIMLILLASVALLLRKRGLFDRHVLSLLIASVVVTMISEFAFTLYRDPTGLSNVAGHYLKIVSFYLIYRAIVETGITRPVALLFRGLKQREEALQNSESRFRQLAETVHDAFWLGTAGNGDRGKILYVNPAFEEVFGIKAEQIYESDNAWLEMLHEDDRDRVREAMQAFVQGQREYDVEYRIVQEQGQIRWIWAKGYPIRDEKGEMVRTAGIARDITERKQTEENLKRAREETARLARLPAEDPNPVLRISEDGTILYANGASDVVLETWQCRIGERLPESCIRRAIGAIRSGKLSKFEFECHDGTTLLVTLAPVAGEGYLNAYGIDVTDRKRAAEALKTEKEFTETALNAQSDTFFVFEPSTGRAIRWNEAFKKQSGYSDEEIRLMRAPDSYYSEEDLKKAAAAASKIFDEGSTTVELALITKDGRTVPTEYTGSAITDNEGTPRYIIAVGRDITERKRAEDVLQRSEKRFRTLVEGLGQGYVVFMHDMDGNVRYLSPSIEALIGVRPERKIGRHWREYVEWTEEGLTAGVESGRKIRETGKPSEPFIMSYTRNGEIRYMEVAERPTFDDAGHVVGIEGIAKDVSEQIRATQALRRAREVLEERYALTVAAALDGLWDWDIGSNAMEYSARWAELLGYAPDELPHTVETFRSLVHPADSHAMWAAVEHHLADGTPYDVEFRLRTKSGEYRWFRSRGQAQWDAEGRPIRMAGSIQDITDRKEAEDRLRESELLSSTILSSLQDHISVVDPTGRIIAVNDAWTRFAERNGPVERRDVSVGANYLDACRQAIHAGEPSAETALAGIKPVLDGSSNGFTMEYECSSPDKKRWFAMTALPLQKPAGGAVISHRDITEPKLRDEVKELSRRFFDIASRNIDRERLLEQFVAEVQWYVECEAVGIRILDDQGNIPYEAYTGFSKEFYELESALSIKTDQCMCINVIKGDMDPSLGCFTEGGSFYVSGTTRFLATVSEEDKGQTRNVCNAMGYETVALVPIFLQDTIIGLIHLADPRENVIGLDMIKVLEGVSGQLGLAIRRAFAESDLRESEQKYRSLYSNMSEGMALYRVVYDEQGNPVDYEILDVNPGFESIMGIEAVRAKGSLASQVYDAKQLQYLRRCAEVAESGRPTTFESYDPSVRKHLRVSVFSPEEGKFATVFSDITDRKRGEEELRQSHAQITQLKDNLQARLKFESLVSDLSARFVNVSCDEVDREIERALKRILKFFAVDRCKLWRVSLDRKEIRITHVARKKGAPPLPEDFAVKDMLPWGFEQVIGKQQAVRVNSLDNLPREAAKDRTTYEAWGTQSILLIPLIIGGIVEYIISISGGEREHPWPEEHIPRLRLLGETFANALIRKWAEEELAKNREALHHLAGRLLSVQEEERRRLARELHDDLTQRLAILAIEIGKLEQQRAVPRAMASKLREIRERTVDLSADIHDISRQLHPSIIEDLGLKHAIRAECANFTKREGILIRYEPADLPRGIPIATAVSLFRIVQEALRNIGKHAKVKEAQVSLVGDEHELKLTIEDSGIGFDMAQTTGLPGLGLASMKERVRLIRGRLSIESVPGQGTIIKVLAPLSGRRKDGEAHHHTRR